MGTLFRFVLYAGDSIQAIAASNAAFARIDTLNNILSDYQRTSELSRLSASSGSGKKIRVSDDLWQVLTSAYQVSEESKGAFDITVGPYVKLWRRARRQKALPDSVLLAKAEKAVGFTKIRLDAARQTVQLTSPDMLLDLGGIAKGYALDEALKVLQQQGITSALADGGGDIAVSNPPPGEKGWRIEIEKTDAQGSPTTEVIWLRNAAIASSGDTYQHLEITGKRYSHLVDPATGIGLTTQLKVTVIAPTGTLADAYASAISVLGEEEGQAFIKNKKQVRVFMVHPYEN